MKILSIDTSTKNLSLALTEDDRALVSKNRKLKILEEAMIPAIEDVLSRAKTTLTAVDAFAVGLGPGSFTSLRVGLATIKGLQFVVGKPVIGIPSLDVLAMSVKDDDVPICAVTDARRAMVYACLYRKKSGILKREGDYWLVPVKDLLARMKPETICIGNGIPILKEVLGKNNSKKLTFAPEKSWTPQAALLARLALVRLKQNDVDDVTKLLPLYLYPEDCQVQK